MVEENSRRSIGKHMTKQSYSSMLTGFAEVGLSNEQVLYLRGLMEEVFNFDPEGVQRDVNGRKKAWIRRRCSEIRESGGSIYTELGYKARYMRKTQAQGEVEGI